METKYRRWIVKNTYRASVGAQGAGSGGSVLDRKSYPVKEKVSRRETGDYEKTVKITCEVDKTAEGPDIVLSFKTGICTLRGRKVVDFTVR